MNTRTENWKYATKRVRIKSGSFESRERIYRVYECEGQTCTLVRFGSRQIWCFLVAWKRSVKIARPHLNFCLVSKLFGHRVVPIRNDLGCRISTFYEKSYRSPFYYAGVSDSNCKRQWFTRAARPLFSRRRCPHATRFSDMSDKMTKHRCTSDEL